MLLVYERFVFVWGPRGRILKYAKWPPSFPGLTLPFIFSVVFAMFQILLKIRYAFTLNNFFLKYIYGLRVDIPVTPLLQ